MNRCLMLSFRMDSVIEGPDWKHLCGAPLGGVCRNFWWRRQVWLKKSVMWKNEARKGDAKLSPTSHSFTFPAETAMDNAVTLNKSKKVCSISKKIPFSMPWMIYRFTVWQHSFAVKLRKPCPITLVSGKNFCCDCR